MGGFNSNRNINMKLFRLAMALFLVSSSSTVLTAFANPLATVLPRALEPRQDPAPTPAPASSTPLIQSFEGSKTSAVPTASGLTGTLGKPKGPVTVTVDVFDTPTPVPNNSILANKAAAAGIFTAVGLVMAVGLGLFGLFLWRRMHKTKESKPIPRKYPGKARTDASSAFSSFYAPNDRSTTGTRSHLGSHVGGGSTRAGSSVNHGHSAVGGGGVGGGGGSRRDDDAMSEVARTVRDGPSLDIQRRLEGNYIPPSPMNPTRPESDPFTTPVDVYDLPYGSPPNRGGPGSGGRGGGGGGSDYSSYPLRGPGSNSGSYNARRGPMSEVSDKNTVVSNWLATSTTTASAGARMPTGGRYPDEESEIGSSRI